MVQSLSEKDHNSIGGLVVTTGVCGSLEGRPDLEIDRNLDQSGRGWPGWGGRVSIDWIGEGSCTLSILMSAVIKSCWQAISRKSKEDLLSVDMLIDICLFNISSSCSWLKRMERTSSTILGAKE